MKRCLALTLILVCFAVPATAELALSLIDNDYYDVPFSTGYLGMDVDRGTLNAYYRDAFRVKDTSYTRNNYTNASIGNLLKIFATQHWDAFKQGPYHRGNYAWYFSNDFSTARVDAAVTDAIKASQLVIPDHGYVKEVEEGMFVTFDFAHFETTQDAKWYPSFFGYRLTFEIDVTGKDAITLTPWNEARFSAWQKKSTNGFWYDETSDKALVINNPVPGTEYQFVHRTSGDGYNYTWPGFIYKLVRKADLLPAVTSPAEDQTVTLKEDEEITLSITAENADAYQWEMLDGEDWVPIEAADGTTLDYGLAALEIDGLQLRCVARNEYGETVSPVFTLDVVTPQQDAPEQDAPAVPQTGDGAPLALYAGAMVLIACALIILRRKATR